MTSDGRTLTIAAINATADAQSVEINLAGFVPPRSGKLWRLTGSGFDASNQIGQPPQVTVTESEFDTGEGTLSVAPYSVELRSYTRRR